MPQQILLDIKELKDGLAQHLDGPGGQSFLEGERKLWGGETQAVEKVSQDTVIRTRIRAKLVKLDNISGEEVLRILTRLAGPPVRVHGSHYIFKNDAGKTVPIPIYFGKPQNRFTLLGALRELGLLEKFYDEVR